MFMLKESTRLSSPRGKILLNSVFVANFSFLSLILLAFPTISNAGPAQNLTLFGATLDNKIMPNCYLRKEYNYFMNQWTTNEICNPRILEVAPRNIPLNNSNAGIERNIYLGPTTANVYNNVNTPFVNGNLGNNTFNYRGFYTGNNNRFSPNTWNGFGSASNYLLGSFGGGIGSNGYFNNYYPNSVFSYLPTSFSARLSWYDDYIPTYFLPSSNDGGGSDGGGNRFLGGSGYGSDPYGAEFSRSLQQGYTFDGYGSDLVNSSGLGSLSGDSGFDTLSDWE